MEYCRSSSKSFKPSKASSPKAFTESDENEQNYHQSFQTPKKPMSKKSYMSPTISAASKSIPTPRKKMVLMERNEGHVGKINQTESPTLLHQVVDESWSKKPITKTRMSVSPRKKVLDQGTHDEKIERTHPRMNPDADISLSNDEMEDAVLADSSSPPYDPLTNYLSPRPQFLRYNPNRRSRVLFSGENGTLQGTLGGGGDDDAASSQCISLASSSSSPSSSGEGSVKQGDQEEIDQTPHEGGEQNQKEVTASSCGSLVSSSPPASGEGYVKQDDHEEIDKTHEEVEQDDEDNQESDDEDEEEEEESRCNSKGVLKTLLWLVVLLLSASCMPSINQSKPLESPVGNIDGFCNVQNSTLDAFLVEKLETGKFVLDPREDKEMGSEVNQIAIGKWIEVGNTSEAVLVKKHKDVPDFMYQQGETEMLLNDDRVDEKEGIEDRNFEVTEHTDMLREMGSFEIGKTESLEVAGGDKKTVVDELGGVVDRVEDGNLEDTEHAGISSEVESLEIGIIEVEIVEGEKKAIVDELGEVEGPQNQGTEEMVPYQMVGMETAEKIESSKDYLISSLSEQHPVASDISHAFLQNEVAVDSIEVYHVEAGEKEKAERRMQSVGIFYNLVGVVVSERINSDTTTTTTTADFSKILNVTTLDNLKELIKFTGIESLFKVLIGVMLFTLIFAASLVFHLKHKGNSMKKDSFVQEKPFSEPVVVEPENFIGKAYSPSLNPYSKAVVAAQFTSVLPSCGDKQLDQQLSSSFRNNFSDSVRLSEEYSGECYHSRAPTVKLLSENEFIEVSSSLRSSVMKNKKTESEANNYSESSERKKWSRRHGDSVSLQPQPDDSEFSTMDFSSYGSFTAEQKIARKEEGKDGEVKVITTPLRRSSRIRNRAVTSP